MKHILSLDGGGTWALLQAQALGALYGADTPGHAVLAQFDLVAANSGGSLVLGCLLANLTPAQIEREFFLNETRRRRIFVRHDLLPWPPRWDTAKKLEGLDQLFAGFPAAPVLGVGAVNQWRLTEIVARLRAWSPAVFPTDASVPRLLIAGFNLDRLRATFFRSHPLVPDVTDLLFLVEALHFSTNAPVLYFNEPARATLSSATGETPFWDGAMGGHNNPVRAALLEGHGRLGWALDEIAILSLGTGSNRLPLAAEVPAGTAPDFVNPPVRANHVVGAAYFAASAILDDPPASALFDTQVLLGQAARGATRLVRLSPLVRPRAVRAGGELCAPRLQTPGGPAADGDLALFALLRDLDMDAVEQPEAEAIATLGRAWLADEVTNEESGTRPMPAARGTTDALRAWQALAPLRPVPAQLMAYAPVPATAPQTVAF